MTKTEIRADAIRGIGQIEALTISSALNAGDESTALFTQQLKKPLSNDEIELMLSNQAMIFHAVGNRQLTLSADLAQLCSTDKGRDASDRYLRNGFKALELSRKCLMALNECRNPKRSTFIKQQNNQLNLGDHDGATVDRIAETTSKRVNPTVATLENVHRCEDASG